uniref:Uncharacterized protein n=1 Tax=Panagrolaimus sp. ES5 TaxID=591445 RepID=A0AC34G4Z0_9BILA
MDMRFLQRALPSSKFAPDPNAEYTFKNPRRQLFDLPYSVMKHIIENANGAVWKKLIQTCKFFYPKKNLYPVNEFVVYSDDSRRIDCTMIIDGKSFDAKSIVPKLWLYNSFESGSQPEGFPDDVTTVLPKIFKCDLRFLNLYFQDLKFEEYQILTSSGTIKEMNLYFVHIVQSNGIRASADKLLDNLYNLEVFKS